MENIQQLVISGAERYGKAIAVSTSQHSLSFQALAFAVSSVATGLSELVQPQQRIAVYLPKTLENVIATFACFSAGAILVPLNPVLKAPQVTHIVNDSEATVLITQTSRLATIDDWQHTMPSLKQVVLVDDSDPVKPLSWANLLLKPALSPSTYPGDSLCALLYTSGSTGFPKGVMLSHLNLLLGAQSVAEYLELNEKDKILAVLPLSFDYGFNQLLTSLLVGAECVLLDHLFPQDIPKACARHGITGLAAVPPLWLELARLPWPQEAVENLRFFTNSGGHMPRNTLAELRRLIPAAQPILMYGLTEAFRSSYVPPKMIDLKPDSMGKAIPHASLYIINEQGQQCAAGEVGELVHAGPLVSQGYWKQSKNTAERFKTLPKQIDSSEAPAVWSGDLAYQDSDGYLYFKGRNDHQLKVSGYRISPEELEDTLLTLPEVQELSVIGVTDEKTGQTVVAVIVPNMSIEFDEPQFIMNCRRLLPAYMVPTQIKLTAALPRNANGKLDRLAIEEMLG